MLILASAVIISLSNNGIILKSNEAVFKTNVKGYQEDLSLYLGDRLQEDTKYDIKSLNADTATSPSIQDVIESMSDKDKTEFIVQNGELVYIGNDEEKINWCDELGIKTQTQKEPLTEAEYNELYKNEIELALQYGEVVDGVYKIKYEYDFDANDSARLPEDVNTLALPYGVNKIKDYAFFTQYNLKKVILPDTVKEIGEKAFWYCGITSINIPKTLTSIDNCAFMMCGLESIELPNGLIYLGDNVFEGATNLKSVILPDKITTIPRNIFSECSSLENIEIPDTVTSIETLAFAKCTSLKNLNLPNGLISIGGSAFYGCDIDELIIPNSVTTIGSTAFAYSHINNLKISSSITKIQQYLFESANIENIIIPKSIVSIEGDAFDSSTVGTVYYEGTEEEWNNIAISEEGNTSLINATKVYNYKY